MLQFINNGRTKKGSKTGGAFKSKELTAAKEHWFAAVQITEYSDELNALRNGKELPPRSKLVLLRPFVDANGMLRVGGRLNLSLETYTKCHPVILPCKHPFVVLLIRSEHLRLPHARHTHQSVVIETFPHHWKP